MSHYTATSHTLASPVLQCAACLVVFLSSHYESVAQPRSQTERSLAEQQFGRCTPDLVLGKANMEQEFHIVENQIGIDETASEKPKKAIAKRRSGPLRLITTERKKGISILVTRMIGADQMSQNIGANIGVRISTALPDYIRQAADKVLLQELVANNIKVIYVPCTIDDHEHAKKIGLAALADVVVWGYAVADQFDPKSSLKDITKMISKSKEVQIGSNNVINAAPGAIVKTGIIMPQPEPSMFRPFVTAVLERNLQTASLAEIALQDAPTLLKLEFPAIASKQPTALLDFLMGLFAYSRRHYQVSGNLFKKSLSALEGSNATSSMSTFHKLVTVAFLSAGLLDDAENAANATLTFCSVTDTDCSQSIKEILAEIYFQKGDDARAIILYEAAVVDKRQEQLPPLTLGRMALLYAHNRQLAKARELCNLGIKRSQEPASAAGMEHDNERALNTQAELSEKMLTHAILLSISANIYRLAKEPKAAIENFLEARKMLRMSMWVIREVYLLEEISNLYEDLKNLNEAIRYLEEADSLSRQMQDLIPRSKILLHLGRLYFSVKNFSKALSALSVAESMIKQLGNRNSLSELYNTQGAVLQSMNNSIAAKEKFDQALAVAQDSADKAKIYRNIGRLYIQQEKVDSANNVFWKAFDLLLSKCDEIEDNDSIYDLLTDLLSSYEQSTSAQKTKAVSADAAVKDFVATLELREKKSTCNTNKSRYYLVTGNLFIQINKDEVALTRLLLAQKYSVEKNNLSEIDLFQIEHDIGDINQKQHQYIAAIEQYEKALVRARKITDIERMIHMLADIGYAYEEQKRFADALKYYLDSLPLLEKLANEKMIYEAYIKIARVYVVINEKARAIFYYQKALPIAEKNDSGIDFALLLSKTSNLLFAESRGIESVELLRKAAIIYQQHGRNQEAGIAAKNAAHILADNKQDQDSVQNYLLAAKMFEKENPKKAAQCLTEAFEITLRQKDRQTANRIILTYRRLDLQDAADLMMPTLMDAQLKGHMKDSSAKESYFLLRTISPVVSAAGLERLKNADKFANCPGVVVLNVEENSPAFFGGVKVGDIILNVNSKCVMRSHDIDQPDMQTDRQFILELLQNGQKALIPISGNLRGLVVNTF